MSVLLRLAARRMDDACRVALADAGSDPVGYAALAVTARFPGRLSHRGLAERIGSDRTTVGRALGDMADDGLVSLAIAGLDARRRGVALTDTGRKALEELEAVLAVAEASALGPLRARERERLRQLLLRALPPRPSPASRWLRPV